jgi:Mg/Co/Ni transporter MgtE
MADEAVLDRIKRAVDADGGDLTQLVEDIGPAAVAEVLPRLSEPQAWALLQSMKEDEIRDVLGLLDPAEAAAIVRGLDRHEAADVLEAMRPDDATDVIEELPRGEAERILVQMEPDDAAEIRGLMSYPEDKSDCSAFSRCGNLSCRAATSRSPRR